MDDVLVVGGGPAGAACALWLHQLGMKVLLLEGGQSLGGLQLRSPYVNRWIPGVPGKTGQEVAAQLQAHLQAAAVPHAVGVDVTALRRNPRKADWEVCAADRTHRARRVVIATGSKPRHGGFVEAGNVGIGPGVSMERIPVLDQRVAILGGGDNAFDMAAFALGRGARSVDIYCRQVPRAQPILQRAVPAHCVHVGPFEADQARMEVNGRAYDVFGVQFGFDACIPGGLSLPLCDGYVQVDRRGAVPSHPGLFAVGDVTNYWHPCVATAAAHGVQVAKSIHADHLAAAPRTLLSTSSGPHAPRPARALAPALP